MFELCNRKIILNIENYILLIALWKLVIALIDRFSNSDMSKVAAILD
jgi:hypothetical protein